MRRSFAVAAFAWAVAVPGAQAQCDPEPDPPPNMRSVARGHYNDGAEAAQAERWEVARAAFQRANDIAAFAQIVFNLATAQAHTGNLVESAESYRRFLRRCASEEMPDLRSDAHALLAEVSPRVGRLTLRIHDLHPATDTLTLDGVELAPAVLGGAIPVNPGTRHLTVVREGEGQILEHTLEMSEGQSTTLELSVAEYVPPAVGGRGGGGGGREGGDDTGLIVGVTLGAVAVLGAVVAILLFFLLQPEGQPLPSGTWEPARLPLIRF